MGFERATNAINSKEHAERLAYKSESETANDKLTTRMERNKELAKQYFNDYLKAFNNKEGDKVEFLKQDDFIGKTYRKAEELVNRHSTLRIILHEEPEEFNDDNNDAGMLANFCELLEEYQKRTIH